MNALMRSPYKTSILAVLAIILIIVFAKITGSIHSRSILKNLQLSQSEKLDVQVYLPFEPERFHLEKLQDVGRYLGWKGDHAVIMQADPDALKAFSRNYWVSGIELMEDVQ